MNAKTILAGKQKRVWFGVEQLSRPLLFAEGSAIIGEHVSIQ
jgi:hypothetical protein